MLFIGAWDATAEPFVSVQELPAVPRAARERGNDFRVVREGTRNVARRSFTLRLSHAAAGAWWIFRDRVAVAPRLASRILPRGRGDAAGTARPRSPR